MTIRQLLDIADENMIDVDFVFMRELCAVSIPGSVAIDRSKYDSETAMKCDLAHELGHCITRSFYRADATDEEKQRCEDMADTWAVLRLMPGLEDEIAHGNDFPAALALRYGVTKDFARRALRLWGCVA